MTADLFKRLDSASNSRKRVIVAGDTSSLKDYKPIPGYSMRQDNLFRNIIHLEYGGVAA